MFNYFDYSEQIEKTASAPTEWNAEHPGYMGMTGEDYLNAYYGVDQDKTASATETLLKIAGHFDVKKRKWSIHEKNLQDGMLVRSKANGRVLEANHKNMGNYHMGKDADYITQNLMQNKEFLDLTDPKKPKLKQEIQDMVDRATTRGKLGTYYRIKGDKNLMASEAANMSEHTRAAMADKAKLYEDIANYADKKGIKVNKDFEAAYHNIKTGHQYLTDRAAAKAGAALPTDANGNSILPPSDSFLSRHSTAVAGGALLGGAALGSALFGRRRDDDRR